MLNLMFLGKLKIPDASQEKAVQENIYQLWEKSFDFLQEFDELETTIEASSVFKTDPGRSVRGTYLKMISRIKSYVDLYRNWKRVESGIPVEEHLATIQNTLRAARLFPGPQNLILSEYIIPIVERISALTSAIIDSQGELNKVYYELGMEPNTNLFPGGQEVFHFMEDYIWNSLIKINAIPLNDDVIEFFTEKKEQFRKYITSPLPDPEEEPVKFKRWARENKKKIWILLYGDMRTPDKKGSLDNY